MKISYINRHIFFECFVLNAGIDISFMPWAGREYKDDICAYIQLLTEPAFPQFYFGLQFGSGPMLDIKIYDKRSDYTKSQRV